MWFQIIIVIMMMIQIVLMIQISLNLSFSIHPYCPPTYILCPQNWCKFMQVDQYLCVWVHRRTSLINVFILPEWFVKWRLSGRTAAVLWGVSSRICSKQYTAFLCSSHQTFSSWIFLVWSIHTVVLPQHAIAWKKSSFIGDIKFPYDQ